MQFNQEHKMHDRRLPAMRKLIYLTFLLVFLTGCSPTPAPAQPSATLVALPASPQIAATLPESSHFNGLCASTRTGIASARANRR